MLESLWNTLRYILARESLKKYFWAVKTYWNRYLARVNTATTTITNKNWQNWLVLTKVYKIDQSVNIKLWHLWPSDCFLEDNQNVHLDPHFPLVPIALDCHASIVATLTTFAMIINIHTNQRLKLKDKTSIFVRERTLRLGVHMARSESPQIVASFKCQID